MNIVFEARSIPQTKTKFFIKEAKMDIGQPSNLKLTFNSESGILSVFLS
jgi:hypothetical protein